MLRILCLSVYPSEGPSVRHRICAHEAAWRHAGVQLALRPFLTRSLFRRRRRFGLIPTLYKTVHMAFCTIRLFVRLASAPSYDIVIIHREVFPLGGAWFERLVARLNPRTVFDIDDALWLPMPLQVDQRRFLWNAERVSRTMSACAAVVAGNTFLRAYAGPRNATVKVIPTPYRDLGGGVAAAARTSRPIIVWIGNVGNEEYLEIVRRPLERLAAERDFVLRVIGSREAHRLQMRGVSLEILEWREDREREWLLECAVGIMPLRDREYERGKCSFKLLQYFSAGMPVVASPIGMNSEVVTHGRNGFLATSDQDWYRALDHLLADAALRSRMGANGYETYRQRFTPEHTARLWLDVFRRLQPAHFAPHSRQPQAASAGRGPGV